MMLNMFYKLSAGDLFLLESEINFFVLRKRKIYVIKKEIKNKK